MTASKFSDHAYSWTEIRHLIESNQLEQFDRSKDQIERYHRFEQDLHDQGTSLFKHLLVHSLKWALESEFVGVADSQMSIALSGAGLFENVDDVKVVLNEFSYFFEDNVTHLCVWSKRSIESDLNSAVGDLSADTRAVIEKYVQAKFVVQLGIPPENIVWFRNWAALQSIKEISHIHVLVRNMDSDQLQKALTCAL
ncbi:hypothetical protein METBISCDRAFT_22108 [Metschnikowia bicuspidata]|uniref:Uncharacterized protein n=1 Tax=Metschnikowia bicuspidata TaxID=27322 RepID=A0A4P9ZI24_9ASCO|nr:hypothetical protein METBISCDRAFT_22108 [Metschnikowia bicuspidata]